MARIWADLLVGFCTYSIRNKIRTVVGDTPHRTYRARSRHRYPHRNRNSDHIDNSCCIHRGRMRRRPGRSRRARTARSGMDCTRRKDRKSRIPRTERDRGIRIRNHRNHTDRNSTGRSNRNTDRSTGRRRETSRARTAARLSCLVKRTAFRKLLRDVE
ncbi:hypothetical protein EVAR_15918_1 [Eumeta japonica]|uniref:Uncharacterized protein n=1 Tax=Eumeta variegata TaxID=151549 RepID=A0A4C1UL47_EUMVA|nr:hypothetical protein EVAR_15918_1 [Eumeta japonica]